MQLDPVHSCVFSFDARRVGMLFCNDTKILGSRGGVSTRAGNAHPYLGDVSHTALNSQLDHRTGAKLRWGVNLLQHRQRP
jgi:hypothetical protein